VGEQRVVVVGGGLAGMATAVWLADLGYAVTLLESNGNLGGRTIGLTSKHGDAVETSLPDMPRVQFLTKAMDKEERAGSVAGVAAHAVPVERRPAPAAPPRQQPPLAKVPAVGRVAAPPTQEPSPGGRLHESERHGIAAPSSNVRMW